MFEEILHANNGSVPAFNALSRADPMVQLAPCPVLVVN
jgi:hypothetical protein